MKRIIPLILVIMVSFVGFGFDTVGFVNGEKNNEEMDAYEKYESTMKNIQTFELTVDDLRNIKELFPHDDKLIDDAQKVIDLLNNPLHSQNRSLIINHFKTLYLEYISADSNSDVLYYYLIKNQKFMESMLEHEIGMWITQACG